MNEEFANNKYLAFLIIEYIEHKLSKKNLKLIKKSGKFNSPNNAFTIAKMHGAYDYVEVTNHERIYSIEEFEEIFLID